jgi:hypothetical protein
MNTQDTHRQDAENEEVAQRIQALNTNQSRLNWLFPPLAVKVSAPWTAIIKSV